MPAQKQTKVTGSGYKPYNWRHEYKRPRSLGQARLRIVYGLRELVGGSPHRGLDVLITGCTKIPSLPTLKEIEEAPPEWLGLDMTYNPPQLPWPVKLPDHLDHAEARIIRALDLILEHCQYHAGIRALRHVVLRPTP